ncbi:hypothetical protein [Adhaeribacter soli]|uniref:Peptidase C39-like domain-containing protein n=1 Tax=Adhaeribacter soli TaxID=2607655 RepID=A0A5N1IW71_9BACT|nr:hypothetical protein [Adhaeribacter soli]KAA9332689.1 hypothetical protein F0P94_11820 [Adhaeribacter soli]
MPINVIDLLETTECGPEAYNENGEKQEVFLNQGSIDGACGPYSILMALLSIGLVNRDEVTSFNTDGRTRLGKFLKNIGNDYNTLFRDGTHLHDLEKIVKASYGGQLSIEFEDSKNKKIINFTLEHLKQNHPTIIGLNYSGGGHWMLAVGFESDAKGQINRLLLLDPSGNKPVVSSWNTIIDLNITKAGIYPYKWWTADYHIQFDQAIALWNKKVK